MASEATLKLLLLGEDRSAGKTLRGAGKDADSARGKFGQLASASGKALAGGLLAAGAAAIKFGNQASDLGETQSKVAQIFGKESVTALDSFADAAARNLGQSKQQALDAAATFGIIGKSAGKSGTDLVDFSTEMTALAGDLASFNNSTPEEAIEAIGSAMRGEAEPIRKYGVLLDDATLRAEALQLGLIKSVKEGLTPQQKALAAQAAILKQTKDAQGDFARTSDGLANKNRILKAEFANMTTELGTKALPAMLAVTAAGLDMIHWIDENQVLVGALVGALGGLLGAVWAINAAVRAYTAVQVALNVVMAMNPIGLVVIAIGLLVAAFVIAYKKSEAFRDIVNGALGAVKNFAVGAFEKIRSAAGSALNWIRQKWPVILAIITGPIGLAVLAVAKNWDKIKAGFNALVGFVRRLPGRISAAASGMFNGLKDAFRGAINWIIDKWNGLSFSLPSVKIPGIGKVGGATLSTPDIPRLAKGGIVRARPGGTLALLAEGGDDEMVTPLSGPNAPSFGAAPGSDLGTLTVVVKTETGEVIEQKLARLKRTRGGSQLAFA